MTRTCFALFLALCGPAAVLGQSCDYASWSVPTVVTGLESQNEVEQKGQHATVSFIRSPSLALGRERSVVVGFDLPVFTGLMRRNPLIALDLSGRDLGRPEGEFAFRHPHAVLDPEGRLHVLWGEPDTIPKERSGQFSIRSVWHAVHDMKGGWSRPQKVYASTDSVGTVEWSPPFVDLQFAPDSTLRVTLGAFPRMLHMTYRSGTWYVDTVQARVGIPSAFYGPGGQISIGFIGTEKRRLGPNNDVAFLRSDDGGRTWRDPVLVHLAGQERARRAIVLGSPDGALHLLWAQSARGGGFTETGLRHSVSRDGGETWTPFDEPDQPAPLQSFKAVADRCGSLHIIYESERTGPTNRMLSYVRWQDGVWSEPESLTPELHINEYDLKISPDGDLILFFSGRPRGTEGLLPWYEPMVMCRPSTGQAS